MKKIISLLLILVTILSMTALTGCGESDTDTNSGTDTNSDSNTKLTDADLLVGTWICDDDFGKKYANYLKTRSFYEDYVPQDTTFVIKYTATFTKDGKCTIKPQDDIEQVLRSFFTDLYTTILTDKIEIMASTYGISEEEYMNEYMDVLSVDEYVDTIVEDEISSSLYNASINRLPDIDGDNFKYTIANGKIEIDEDELYSAGDFNYTIDKETLTLTEIGAEDSYVYPLTFKKSN